MLRLPRSVAAVASAAAAATAASSSSSSSSSAAAVAATAAAAAAVTTAAAPSKLLPLRHPHPLSVTHQSILYVASMFRDKAPRSATNNLGAYRSFHASSLAGAKKTPSGSVAANKEVEVDEDAEIGWQTEEELRRLAEAPAGVSQFFWNFQRELTVRTAPVPEGQQAYPPEPEALGELIDKVTNLAELKHVFPVMASWRLSHLPVKSEYTTKIVDKALEYGSPETTLLFLGDGEKYYCQTDGSHFRRLFDEFEKHFESAKKLEDDEAELKALDDLYLTFALFLRYPLANRKVLVGETYKRLARLAAESRLTQGWWRAVVTATEYQRMMDAEFTTAEKASSSFNSEEIASVTKIAEAKKSARKAEKMALKRAAREQVAAA